MEKICKNCAAWDEHENNMGFCRRIPPSEKGGDFPMTKTYGWCLKFIPKGIIVQEEEGSDCFLINTLVMIKHRINKHYPELCSAYCEYLYGDSINKKCLLYSNSTGIPIYLENIRMGNIIFGKRHPKCLENIPIEEVEKALKEKG